MTAFARWEQQAFAAAPEPAVVVDHSGTIVAVNAAWSASASSAGGGTGCGVGADYVRVCRAGMDRGAPGARRAHADLTAVLAARTPHATSVYPCAGPEGLRWFRSDVFALGHGEGVCIRHLDLADGAPAPGLRLHRLGTSPDDRGGPDDPSDADTFHDGLDELLQSSGPHVHVVVLVAAIDEPDHDVRQTAALLAQLIIARAASTPVAGSARIDLVAPVGPADIGVATSAPSLAEAVRAADHLRVTTDRRLPHRTVWGLAVATGGGEGAAGVVDRARQAVADAVDAASAPVRAAEAPSDDERTDALHRAARRLSDAVAEFDTALERGLALTELVARDREVRAAENACLAAAGTRRHAGAGPIGS